MGEVKELARLVAGVWRVMGCAVVEADSGWEAYSRLKAIRFHQGSRAVLDVLNDLRHRHAGPDMLPCMFPDLSLDFSGAPDILVGKFGIFHSHLLIVPLFFRGGPPGVTDIKSEPRWVQ